MINAMRSEAIKLLSLRSTWVYAILLTGSLYGPVLLLDLRGVVDWEHLTRGAMIFCMVATIFMGSTVAGEIETRMYAYAFLTQGSRSYWLLARYLVNMVFLTLCFFTGMALSFLVVLLLSDATIAATNISYLYTPLGLTGLFTLVAAGVAVVSRSKIAAVSVPLLWGLIVDNLIAVMAARAKIIEAAWLVNPSSRISQMGDQLGNIPAPPGWGLGTYQPIVFNIGVVGIWVVALVAAAYLVNSRKDVH